MDVTDIKALHPEVKKRMDTVLEHLKRELGGVRTGRASVTLLDPVQVEAYGSMVPLNQVAALSVPEPTLIVAQPFDPSQLGAIEKAIRSAGLGLNPANDGKVVRIPLPALTEERRKELSKHVHHEGENSKVAIRNIRRDAIQHVKEMLKEKTATEDEARRSEDEIQKITDKSVKDIDEVVKAKEQELLAV